MLGCALLAAAATARAAVPAFDQVRQQHRPSEVAALARDGTPVGWVRTDSRARRAAWTPLDAFSPALVDAVLASEDARFFEHGGVDWRAMAGALRDTASGTRRGASTITMQLAGLVDPQLGRGPGGRSLVQKADQAAAALAIERRWSKGQVLEAWLNLVPMTGELVGVPAASRALFGKAPHGLDRTEAAILAALVRAPNAASAAVAQRACRLLRAGAADLSMPQCLALHGRVQLALARAREVGGFAPQAPIAPHLARRAVAAGGGTSGNVAAGSVAAGNVTARGVATTLDARLQRLAADALARHVAELAQRNVEDGAVVVLDNASGEVLAWVGSTGAASDAAQVDFVTARRQAGSTLKPFLYAQAIAERRLTAASLLDDGPLDLNTAAGLYMPQNYDRRHAGPVSVRAALGASLNVPAVRALVSVGPERFFEALRGFGFALRESGDYYGYSLALGSAEVSLLELANAYRALANGGVASAPRWLAQPDPGGDRAQAPALRAQASRRAVSPEAAWIVSDILADPAARARTFGLDSVLNTRGWAAVKTGTSKDMRDNWCVGFSDRYTVGVWVGNASGAPMWGVSGVDGAAPVWAALMRALHASVPSRAPAPPPGLVVADVAFDAGVEPIRTEWFVAGTDRARVSLAPPAAGARIVAPADGAILALDPDIPPAAQRLVLTADGRGAASATWRVGGQEVGRGERVAWLPRPGRHEITLAGRDGATLASVRVEVRGARARPK
jgi:penicillin-binding protein 1C